jgi:hypothetical protein
MCFPFQASRLFACSRTAARILICCTIIKHHLIIITLFFPFQYIANSLSENIISIR